MISGITEDLKEWMPPELAVMEKKGWRELEWFLPPHTHKSHANNM